MKSAVVLSIAALAAAAPKPAGVNSIELGARHEVEWTDATIDAHFEELFEKYEVEVPAHRKRSTSGSIPLTDDTSKYPLDKSYYADGLVNTQTFSIKYDTGSKNFYVPGPKCPAAECTDPTKYNEQGEDEHNITTTNFGGTGAGSSRTGENFLDSVTVAGVQVDKTQVVSLTQRIGKPQVRAIMGLSFGLRQGKPATYFEAAMAQGKVAANEFAFFLGRGVSGTAAKSEMTIGGRNPAKYTGDLVTLPVVDFRHWNVDFGGFVQNGNLIPNTGGVATLDTGTSFIIGPYEQAAAFWAGIPGSIKHREKSAPYDVYEYPCNSKFTTALRLNGTDFGVSPKDYNVKYLLKGGLCLGFVAGGPFETWIVGDSFLKNWYSIYSYDAANGAPAVLLGAGKA